MSKKELIQAVKDNYPLHLVESTIQGIELCEKECARTAQIIEVFGEFKALFLEDNDIIRFDERAKIQTLGIAVCIVNKAA